MPPTDNALTIPAELADQVGRGNVALFVGMGLSAGAGLPGWDALIGPLAERTGGAGGDLLQVAQAYEDQVGRQKLLSYLMYSLDTASVAPTENHALLAQLPINTVFTTNLDDLLERAYRNVGKRVNLIVAPELPFFDATQVNLFQLHGALRQPNSVKITARDYASGIDSLIVQKLTALLATRTALFIGYSLRDPDFNQLYDQLGELGGYQRRPYLAAFDVDPLAAKGMEKRGFHVIALSGEGNRTVRLGEWLRALTAAVAAPGRSRVPVGVRRAPVVVSGAAIGGNVVGSVIVVGDGNGMGRGGAGENPAAVRELLTTAFDDEELTAFCFDHFRSVYEQFSSGMSKTQKVQRLVEYCDRQTQTSRLLRLVGERRRMGG